MTATAISGWQEEKRSAYLYRVIAAEESDPDKRQLFRQLAEEAEKQAALWAAEMQKQGLPARPFDPGLRLRLVAALVRIFGPFRVRGVLAASKIRGLSVYSGRRLAGMHPLPATVDEVGASHRGTSSSGGLRAAVFGVNDGLVSIACLVLGVAGAASEQQTIVLTGMAGLMAGAFSMAAGEYISMRSQREMFEHQIDLEREELAQYPQEETHELTLIYMARGMQPEQASALAQHMIADPKLGLDTLAREELGLNPDELGSPWIAAVSSFLAFVAGGLVPLMPYLLGLGRLALPLTMGLSALTLFAVGAALSLFSGKSAWMGGLRMLLIGAAAGGMTYLIGGLVGASIA